MADTDFKRYFKSICEVSRGLSGPMKFQDRLDLIVAKAVTTMGAKAGALFLADSNKQLFDPVAQTGLSANYAHTDPETARKQVENALKGGYLAVENATSDPRVSNHASKKAEGIASILAVPMLVRGHAIGILAIYTAEPRKFTDDDADFLTALAEQGGMSIENAKIIKRMRTNIRLFLDLATGINASLDITKILQRLTADLAKALGMKGSAIWLLEETEQSLKYVAGHGLSSAFIDKGPLSASQSVAQALKGETVIVTDVLADERIQYPQAFADEGIEAMLTAPIFAGETIIGVVRLYSAHKRKFPDEFVMLVNAIAAQGGLAIQNANMYLRVEEAKKDLEETTWGYRSWF